MKIKKILLVIVLFIGGCMSSTLLMSQENNIKLLTDTLNFEYEGPIEEHEKIIIRTLSSLHEIQKQDVWYRGTDYSGYEEIMKYPLVKSFKHRINYLIDDYLIINAKITKIKKFEDYYNKYELPNLLYPFYDVFLNTASKIIADNYLEIIIRFYCGIPLYPEYKERRFLIAKDLKDEDFAKLVSETAKYGIKKIATKDGFYNKELAMNLSKAILFNRIKDFLKSNKELDVKIIYVVDAYDALSKLSDEGQYKGQNEKQQNEILEKMIMKY